MEKSHSSKLIVTQPVKKFPSFCGNERFVISYTGAFHRILCPHTSFLEYLFYCTPSCMPRPFNWSPVFWIFNQNGVYTSHKSAKCSIIKWKIKISHYIYLRAMFVSPAYTVWHCVDNQYLIYAFSLYATFSRNRTTKQIGSYLPNFYSHCDSHFTHSHVSSHLSIPGHVSRFILVLATKGRNTNREPNPGS